MATASHPAVVTAAGVHILHPGDVVCAERNERLETLLGSCIAIVLTDPRSTIGVMCHIVHSKQPLHDTGHSGVYADAAIEIMYAQLIRRGFSPRLCKAYVYGGGNMFPAQFNQTHVGDDNSRWVLERLKRDGVRVLLHDVGGTAYRRLTWTIGSELPQVVAVSVESTQA